MKLPTLSKELLDQNYQLQNLEHYDGLTFILETGVATFYATSWLSVYYRQYMKQ
jgi:hypothetical protein